MHSHCFNCGGPGHFARNCPRNGPVWRRGRKSQPLYGKGTTYWHQGHNQQAQAYFGQFGYDPQQPNWQSGKQQSYWTPPPQRWRQPEHPPQQNTQHPVHETLQRHQNKASSGDSQPILLQKVWSTILSLACWAFPQSARPIADVTVGGKSIKTLFDSGAEVSLINHDTYTQLPDRPSLHTYRPGLAAANGTVIQVTGTGLFKFKLGTKVITHPAVVVSGLHIPCIIGADLMGQHGIEIDMGSRRIKVKADTASKPSQIPLKAKKNYVLEPFTEKLIETIVQEKPSSPDCVLHIHQQDLPITIEEGIGEIEDLIKCTVPVRNLTAEQVHLHRGQPIGFGHFIQTTSVSQVDEVILQSKTSTRLSNSFTSVFNNEIMAKLKSIPEQFKGSYNELLSRFSDVFSVNPDDVGHCTKIPQHIRLKDPQSVSSTPPYRLPHNLLPVAHEYVKKLLARDIIRPSTSPFSSPLMLVRKPGKGDPSRPMVEQFRIVHDYRRLNTLTVRDCYPMRNLFELIDEVSQGKIFTVIDLSQGFWNQELTEDSKPYTAFGVPGLGHFEYNRSAQGLCNSPPAFQRMLDHITRGLPGTFVYLDDVVIVSKSHSEHLNQLDKVLQRFKEYGIKCRLSKLQLATAEINYLGYNISSEHGIRPGALKTEAIRQWMPPTEPRHIKQFLGLCSFFRRTIKNYARIAAPLTKLTRKDAPWKGGPLPATALAAFRTLQKCLITRPCLKPVDFNREFILTVDTSTEAIGAILSQVDEKGHERPCAYASRVLNETESRYAPTHLEGYGLLWACRHFRPYLVGRHFTIRTDHKPLTALNKTSGFALDRINAELQSFLPYTITYLPGDVMPADGLSRPVAEISNPPNMEPDTLPWISVTPEQLYHLQQTDKYIKALVCHVKFGLTSRSNRLRRFVGALKGEVVFQNGIAGIQNVFQKGTADLQKSNKFLALAPYHIQSTLLQLAHDSLSSGHLGPEKTLKRIQQDWFWPGMKDDVYNYCRSCHVCLKSNYPSNKKPAPLEPMPPAIRFNQRVHLDLLGPLPRSEGNQYVLVMSDAFSSWVELTGIPDKQTTTVSNAFIRTWVAAHSLPERINTDKGKEFDSKIFAEMAAKLGIKHSFSSSGHPRSNGQVEAVNKDLIKYIRKFIETNDQWSDLLPNVKLAMNTAPHTSKKYSPFFATYARRPNLATMLMCPTRNYSDEEISQRLTNLANITKDIQKHQSAAFEQQKQEFDKRARQRTFQPGDLVYVTRPHSGKLFQKFQPLFDGPYRIVEARKHNNYKIMHEKKRKTVNVHIDRLKLATVREQFLEESPEEGIEPEADDNRLFKEFEEALESLRLKSSDVWDDDMNIVNDQNGNDLDVQPPGSPPPPPPAEDLNFQDHPPLPPPPPRPQSPPPLVPPQQADAGPSTRPRTGSQTKASKIPSPQKGSGRPRLDTYPGGTPSPGRRMPIFRPRVEEPPDEAVGGARPRLGAGGKGPTTKAQAAIPGGMATRQSTKAAGIKLPEAHHVALPETRKARKRKDLDGVGYHYPEQQCQENRYQHHYWPSNHQQHQFQQQRNHLQQYQQQEKWDQTHQWWPPMYQQQQYQQLLYQQQQYQQQHYEQQPSQQQQPEHWYWHQQQRNQQQWHQNYQQQHQPWHQ